MCKNEIEFIIEMGNNERLNDVKIGNTELLDPEFASTRNVASANWSHASLQYPCVHNHAVLSIL